MIRIAENIKKELESESFTAVTCLRLTFSDTETLLLTDGPRDVTVGVGVTVGDTVPPGTAVYLASDRLRAISAPQSHTDVDRDNYSVTFLDADHGIRNKYVGKSGLPLEVGVTFMDEEGNFTDLLLGYQGFSSAVESREEDGTRVTTVHFTGQLAQLDTNNPRLTTVRSQQAFDANDTAFKYVHDASNRASIKWGKK